MAAGKVKKKEHERLDDENVERVMALFEAEKPITIKQACEELNIAANGVRLKKIFQEFKDAQELRKRLRGANRGKPAQPHEISTIAESYLVNESIKSIAEQLHRSESFVKRIVEDLGIPRAIPGENYSNFEPLPEQCIADSFDVGEFVWSSRDCSIAEVMKELPEKDGVKVYRLWVHQRIDPELAFPDGKRYKFQPETGGGYFSHQLAYDIGSLKHLQKYNVDVKRAIK